MVRAVCFDVTHLVSRLTVHAPSGIDKVDQAYGRHFAARALGPAIHYGLNRPHVLAPTRMQAIVDLAVKASWEAGENGSVTDSASARDAGLMAPVERWLLGAEQGDGVDEDDNGSRRSFTHNLMRAVQKAGLRVTDDRVAIPEGAVYLNVAQHGFEFPRFFRWLQQRSDVRPVFLMHDLLPLDEPQYFRPGYRSRFDARVTTATRHGAAFLTTTDAVRQRLEEELKRRGRPRVPIHVAPLPTSLNWADAANASDARFAQAPYFVVLGTIEPRKNHLLLLNIWRQLAERGGPVPKLVIVGARGWENEQVIDVLDRGLLTRPHVMEVSGLRAASLVRLIKNARALLMPSFAEGYGLPVVEALTLGTPVIASDIHVFREVSQGCAILKHPLDGVGWRETIDSLTSSDSPALLSARALAARFDPPTWSDYFRGVEDFLRGDL